MVDQVTDDAMMKLALGRLFAMMQRPERDGDVEMYCRIRDAVMASTDDGPSEYAPNYARDRRCGARGDA